MAEFLLMSPIDPGKEPRNSLLKTRMVKKEFGPRFEAEGIEFRLFDGQLHLAG